MIFGFDVNAGFEGSAIDQLAMASSVPWYGHVLRSEDGEILWSALDFDIKGQGKKGRPKRMWYQQVEEECVKVFWEGKMLFADECGVGVNQISVGLRWIWPPSLVGDTMKY